MVKRKERHVSGYSLAIDLKKQNMVYRHSYKTSKIYIYVSKNHNYVSRVLHFITDGKFQ